MKRLRLFAVVLIALVVAGLALYFWPKPTEKLKSAGEPSEKVQQSAALPKSSPYAAPSAAPTVTSQPEAVKNLPDTSQQTAFLAAFAKPISFWGKVIDQNGNPVADATIHWSANNDPSANGSGSNGTVTSDSAGTFFVKSSGIALYASASKDGYEQLPTEMGVKVGSQAGFNNTGKLGNTDLPIGTQSEPSVLTLRKMGDIEPLYHVRQRPVQLSKNGNPAEVNLQNGAPGTGGLKVECWTQDQTKDEQGRYDWRCRLSVPGGGLVERTDTFEAPVNGYQPMIEIAMPRTAEKWNKGASKEFFAKLPDGRYARFSFDLTTAGHHFFVLESYVNPTAGNRSLEYDPNKTVTPDR